MSDLVGNHSVGFLVSRSLTEIRITPLLVLRLNIPVHTDCLIVSRTLYTIPQGHCAPPLACLFVLRLNVPLNSFFSHVWMEPPLSGF